MSQPDNFCELPLGLEVDGAIQPQYTTLLRTCAYGAVLDTKVIAPDLHAHLNSHYLGDPDRSARSTHFLDAPGQVPPHTSWVTQTHAPGELDVRWTPSGCLYDHLQRLLDLLAHLGRAAKIDVSDAALGPFEALALGLSVAAARPELPPMRSDVAVVLSSWRELGSAGERHAKA